MYREILKHYIEGLINSLRLTELIPILFHTKMKNIIYRLTKFNLIYLISSYFIYLFTRYIQLYFDVMFNFFLMIASNIFHLLHYIETINYVSNHASRSKNTTSLIDMMTIGLTMTVYQIGIYLTINIVYFLFYHRFYLMYLTINYFLIATYHSLYAYNNLWQFKKVDLDKRTSIHEKLWPYYLGYGTVATILYFYMDNIGITIVYNFYLILIICIPFLTEKRYPSRNYSYPKINLSFFSFLAKMVTVSAKKLIKTGSSLNELGNRKH